MYLWDLVGDDPAEGSLCSGLGDDLAAIMRVAEPLLVKRAGVAVHIVEVVRRMSVLHLGAVHVPIGREWLGRLDGGGGVSWAQCCRSADPDVGCGPSRDVRAIAS